MTSEKNPNEKSLTLPELDIRTPILRIVTDEFREISVAFLDQLIKEYDCKTPSEKVLAQMATNAYTRSFEYSEKLRDCLAIEWHSSEKNGFFSLMSKEIDRASRQYNAAIILLKQMRMPPIELNVKTKTAFIVENQQINVNPGANENIEPK